MLHRHAALLITLIAAPLWAQSPSASPADASAAPTQIVTVAVEAFPETLDPAATQPGPPTVIAALHEPLVRIKLETNELDPATSLAAKVNVTGDNLLWEISLKANLQFSDGTPLDAEAVAFSIGRLLKADHPAHPAQAMVPASARGVVKNIAVRDKTTLVLELNQPYSPLLSLLASPHAGIISPASFKSGKLANPPVGAGAFTLARSGPGKRLELVPNIRLNRQRPNIARIDVVPAPPGPARLLWLLANRGDLVEGLSRRDSEDLGAYPRIKVNRAPGLGMVTIYINPNSTPFQAPLLREAALRGIPDDLLGFYLYDSRCQSFRAFYPPWSWGPKKWFKGFAYDAVEAKRLLGLANVDRNGTAFVMWIVPPAGTTKESLTPFLESLRASLRELNISCLTEVVARADLGQRLAASGPQAIMYWHETVTTDPDEVATASLSKESPLAKFAGVNQDEVLALVQQARTNDNRTSREYLYEELEQRMAQAVSVLSVGCPQRIVANSERLTGFKFGLDGLVSLEDLRVGP